MGKQEPSEISCLLVEYYKIFAAEIWCVYPLFTCILLIFIDYERGDIYPYLHLMSVTARKALVAHACEISLINSKEAIQCNINMHRISYISCFYLLKIFELLTYKGIGRTSQSIRRYPIGTYKKSNLHLHLCTNSATNFKS